MLVNLQAILLVTGFIKALGQIIQIPDTPSITIGGFYRSQVITIDEEDRRVYVGDRDVNVGVVRVLNENGGLILTISVGTGIGFPGGIAISTTGLLYIPFHDRIEVTTKGGYLLSTIGTAGSGEGQFLFPYDVAIGPDDGLLYVADTQNHRVQVLTLDGQFVKQLDLPGSTYSVAFGTDGRLHVTVRDSSKIVVFDADGTEVQTVDLEYQPIQIYIDSCGYIYVTSGYIVNIYDEYYNLLRIITRYTSGATGIARWEGKNEIWTTDNGKNVYVFSGP